MAAYHSENMKEANIHESRELQPRKSRVIHSLDHKGNYYVFKLNKTISISLCDQWLIAQDNARHWNSLLHVNFLYICCLFIKLDVIVRSYFHQKGKVFTTGLPPFKGKLGQSKFPN